MQINDPERTRQAAAPELRLNAPEADDFTEHPLSMNGEAPAGKSARGGTGATAAAPSFSCAASCPLSHVPQKAWLHLFRVPFRKRHPVIFWGLLLLLLGGLAAFMVSRATGLGSERIALVRVTGPIMDIDAQLRWIDELGRMPGVKGVLVRVDSPGGGAAASQELYGALARLGKDKPVAVSMGSTAASGGLMVSMAGRRVFANASTVTGSIGVRMDIPQIRGLLDKLGLGRQTLTTAPYKDAGSMLERSPRKKRPISRACSRTCTSSSWTSWPRAATWTAPAPRVWPRARSSPAAKPWSWALWTSWAASRPRTAGWPMSARCPWTGPC